MLRFAIDPLLGSFIIFHGKKKQMENEVSFVVFFTQLTEPLFTHVSFLFSQEYLKTFIHHIFGSFVMFCFTLGNPSVGNPGYAKHCKLRSRCKWVRSRKVRKSPVLRLLHVNI